MQGATKHALASVALLLRAVNRSYEVCMKLDSNKYMDENWITLLFFLVWGVWRVREEVITMNT